MKAKWSSFQHAHNDYYDIPSYQFVYCATSIYKYKCLLWTTSHCGNKITLMLRFVINYSWCLNISETAKELDDVCKDTLLTVVSQKQNMQNNLPPLFSIHDPRKSFKNWGQTRQQQGGGSRNTSSCWENREVTSSLYFQTCLPSFERWTT